MLAPELSGVLTVRLIISTRVERHCEGSVAVESLITLVILGVVFATGCKAVLHVDTCMRDSTRKS